MDRNSQWPWFLQSIILLGCLSQNIVNSGRLYTFEELFLNIVPCKTAYDQRGYCIPVERCRPLFRKNSPPLEGLPICSSPKGQSDTCCFVRIRTNKPSSPIPEPRKSRASSFGPSATDTASTSSRRRRSIIRLNPPGCGKRPEAIPLKRTLLVAGGSVVNTIHHWPWMAAIRVKSGGNVTTFLCGGTLITQRHVLTAAHCFGPKRFRRPLSDYTVILGRLKQEKYEPLDNKSHRERGVVIATPTSLSIHKDFKYSENAHDIAVISIDTDVASNDWMRPVCLPSGSQLRQDHGQVTVIGWGDVNFGGKDSDILKEASLKVVPANRCRRLFRDVPDFRNSITSNVICAGDARGQKGACKGDSGGPLLMEDDAEDDKWVQVGIVAFGYRCAEQGYPGVYVRVGSYVPWIERVIRQSVE